MRRERANPCCSGTPDQGISSGSGARQRPPQRSRAPLQARSQGTEQAQGPRARPRTHAQLQAAPLLPPPLAAGP
eukprot:4015203-Alexandrium_andersonii.AAC.1